MNYSQRSIREKKNRITGTTHKVQYRVRGLMGYVRVLFFLGLFLGMIWNTVQYVEDIIASAETIQRAELLSPGKTSVLYDMDGKEIQTVSHQDTNQTYVSLAKIPDSVRKAFVTSRDVYFYKHNGVNMHEILQNLYDGLFHNQGKKTRNMTLTRQLLQNRLNRQEEEESLSRHIREQYLAITLEDKLGKDEILELYLNTINMGENIMGVQAASQYYFDKDIAQVTISEAAVLAAIVEEPAIYNPITSQSENNAYRKTVLKSMLEAQAISEAQYEDALGDDVYLRMENVRHNSRKNIEYSYYTDAVLEQVLQDMKSQLGYTQTQAYNTLFRCGVKIYTCQDTEMQKICDEVIDSADFREKKKQASFVLIEQGTGEIKAIVGGAEKNYSGGVNYATKEKRQPGTLFDILSVYTPAMDTVGMSLGTVENDASYLLPDTLAPVSHWRDSEYKGLVTIREALHQSLNVPAVKILERVTIQTGYEYLKRFGITSLVEQKPFISTGTVENSPESDLQFTMALGRLTEGVTNLEMTAAYGAIANQGVYKVPRFYNRVVDSQGNVLLENKSEGKRIMKETTAWLLTNALRDKENDLSGKGEEKRIYVSGRYALSSEKIDDWYEGYSPYYTGGIWIRGENEPEGNPAGQAKVIWKRIMERVHRQRKISRGSYKKPVDIVEADICTKCGNLAVRGLCAKAEGGSTQRREFFALGTQPEKNCTCHVPFLFCEDSRALASEECPNEKTYTRILLEKKETTETEDTPNTVAQNVSKDICKVHGKEIEVK